MRGTVKGGAGLIRHYAAGHAAVYLYYGMSALPSFNFLCIVETQGLHKEELRCHVHDRSLRTLAWAITRAGSC